MSSSPRHACFKRSTTTASLAASDTTYHSFHDIELSQPAPQKPVQIDPPLHQDALEPMPMRRQDSGYESTSSASKSLGSKSRSSPDSQKRTSTVSSHSSSQVRTRTRPSIHRATSSTPSPHNDFTPRRSLQHIRSQQLPNTYFHFPNPEVPWSVDEGVHDVEEPSHPPPPQTTHYWTSDHTRRLEYAAIDATSSGVKGWLLRHMIPDCFVPKENRRLCFDDDTGSVRRYRLELDCEEGAEKNCGKGKKLGWLFGR